MYKAHNNTNDVTISTPDISEAMAHVGRHVHVSGPDGKAASPMDFNSGRVSKVIFWSELTGQVRYRVMTGRP